MITPKLLTNECAAHYPRLWTFIESLGNARNTRKFPVMLEVCIFTHQFEDWVMLITEFMADSLDTMLVGTPWDYYGPDPMVGERLDYLAEFIGDLIAKEPEMGKQILQDLMDWRNAIMTYTAPVQTPKYLTTVKCPDCGYYSIMRSEGNYFCVNNECRIAWAK